MSGHILGVQVCMTKMVPRLLYTHCAVHMLELAMLHSIEFDDSYLENINNNLDGILSFIIYWLWANKHWNGLLKYLRILKNLVYWKISTGLPVNPEPSTLWNQITWFLIYDIEQKSYNQSETGKKDIGFVTYMKQPKKFYFISIFFEIPTKWFAILWNSMYNCPCFIQYRGFINYPST